MNTHRTMRRRVVEEYRKSPRNFFSIQQSRDIMREAAAEYQNWEPPRPNLEKRLEIFAPTCFRSPTESFLASGEMTSKTSHPDRQWVKEVLFLSLYVDKVWLPDPLELLVNDFRKWDPLPELLFAQSSLLIHSPLMRHPLEALDMLVEMEKIEPLIEAGAVGLYPALKCYHNEVAEKLFGTTRGYTEAELSGGWPELYVAEGLLFARSLHANYVALQPEEFGAWSGSASSISKHLGVSDRKVVAMLPRLKLPYFTHLDAASLAAVRLGEETFADFRKLLRELSSSLQSDPDDPNFARDIRELERDSLSPTFQKLAEKVAGIGALKTTLNKTGLDFAAGAIAGYALTADLSKSLLSGSISALSKVLIQTMVEAKKGRPGSQVVYSFHSGRISGKSLGLLKLD